MGGREEDDEVGSALWFVVFTLCTYVTSFEAGSRDEKKRGNHGIQHLLPSLP